MSSRRPALLIIGLAIAFVAAVLLRSGVPPGSRARPVASDAPAAGAIGARLPALDSARVWIGGPPRDTSTAGTVLLLWTMSEPASLRALERAEEWRALYAGDGLRVLAAYVPRFGFDADSATVARELRRRGVHLPVAMDTDLALSRALAPEGALPRVVVADSNGIVIATTAEPAAAERAVRAAVVRAHPELAPPESTGAVPGAPASEAAHAPVLLGAASPRIGPLADATPGAPRTFHPQTRGDIEGAAWVPMPVGLWSLESDGLRAARGGATTYLALRYDAGPVAVLASAAEARRVRLWVLRDDAWVPPDAMDADLRADGRGATYVDIDAGRLYALVRSDGRSHVLKLSPEDPGLVLHGFVFEPVPDPGAPRP